MEGVDMDTSEATVLDQLELLDGAPFPIVFDLDGDIASLFNDDFTFEVINIDIDLEPQQVLSSNPTTNEIKVVVNDEMNNARAPTITSITIMDEEEDYSGLQSCSWAIVRSEVLSPDLEEPVVTVVTVSDEEDHNYCREQLPDEPSEVLREVNEASPSPVMAEASCEIEEPSTSNVNSLHEGEESSGHRRHDSSSSSEDNESYGGQILKQFAALTRESSPSPVPISPKRQRLSNEKDESEGVMEQSVGKLNFTATMHQEKSFSSSDEDESDGNEIKKQFRLSKKSIKKAFELFELNKSCASSASAENTSESDTDKKQSNVGLQLTMESPKPQQQQTSSSLEESKAVVVENQLPVIPKTLMPPPCSAVSSIEKRESKDANKKSERKDKKHKKKRHVQSSSSADTEAEKVRKQLEVTPLSGNAPMPLPCLSVSSMEKNESKDGKKKSKDKVKKHKKKRHLQSSSSADSETGEIETHLPIIHGPGDNPSSLVIIPELVKAPTHPQCSSVSVEQSKSKHGNKNSELKHQRHGGKGHLPSSSAEEDEVDDIFIYYPEEIAKRFKVDKRVTGKDLEAYVGTVDVKEAGMTKENFANELKTLHDTFNDCKKIKRISSEEYEIIALSMEETFRWRYYDIFNLKRMTIHQTVQFYPGLKIFKWLPKEYFLMYPENCSNPDFLDDVERLLVNFVVERTKCREPFQSKKCEKLLKSLKNCAVGKTLTETELVIAAYAFAMEKTNERVKGELFKVRSKDKKLEIKRSTPFIDIVKRKEKNIWDEHYPMTVYIEMKEVLVAKNFYEAVLACYIYYWIFYLDYTDPDDILFRQFDEMAAASKSKKTC